jgi:hypothetical protein
MRPGSRAWRLAPDLPRHCGGCCPRHPIGHLSRWEAAWPKDIPQDAILGWTDGRLAWHAGCIELGEEDVEFRALFAGEEASG